MGEFYPWLVVEDLNEILDEEEKAGGKPVYNRRLHLQDFIHNIEGVDISCFRRKFKWSNNHLGLMIIKEWLNIFPKALEKNLSNEVSYHSPIIFRSNGMPTFKPKPFRFSKAWVLDASST